MGLGRALRRTFGTSRVFLDRFQFTAKLSGKHIPAPPQSAAPSERCVHYNWRNLLGRAPVARGHRSRTGSRVAVSIPRSGQTCSDSCSPWQQRTETVPHPEHPLGPSASLLPPPTTGPLSPQPRPRGTRRSWSQTPRRLCRSAAFTWQCSPKGPPSFPDAAARFFAALSNSLWSGWTRAPAPTEGQLGGFLVWATVNRGFLCRGEFPTHSGKLQAG